MPRLRKLTHMCSRTISGTAYRFRHGSTLCSPTVEKILCRSPYFAAVTCRQSAPDYPRERGDSQEGGNRRCLPSCAPARRQRTPPAAGRGESPRSAERNSPLRFSEKDCRPDRVNRVRGSSTPLSRCRERSRPVRANTPAAVRVPRSAGAEKSCRPKRANTLTQFGHPAQPVLKKTAAQTGAKSRCLLTVYPLYFPVRLDTISL